MLRIFRLFCSSESLCYTVRHGDGDTTTATQPLVATAWLTITPHFRPHPSSKYGILVVSHHSDRFSPTNGWRHVDSVYLSGVNVPPQTLTSEFKMRSPSKLAIVVLLKVTVCVTSAAAPHPLRRWAHCSRISLGCHQSLSWSRKNLHL